MIKYPKPIKPGDTFGITATSMGIVDKNYQKRLDNAHKNLANLGYKCIETNNVRNNSKFVSSTPIERAKQFMELWKNNDISLIGQVYGGEFLLEILPYIKEINNYEPKWVTGYSDSSLLNFFLTTNYNIATITTTNIIHFGMQKPHESLIRQLDILQSNKDSVQENFKLFELEKLPHEEKTYDGFNLTEKVKYKHLYNKTNEKIEGRLVGGCIDVLSYLLGTPYDNTVNFCNQFKEGILWYLENCELPVTSLYRTLWQMKQSGWFNNAKGFIIGRTRSNQDIFDFTYLDALHKIFDDMNVPVIYDVDFGHVAPQWTMINGSYAIFEYNNHNGKITQKKK